MLGSNDPQALDPHVAVQITPAPNGSFVTWYRSGMVALISRVLGNGMVDGEFVSKTATGAGMIVRLRLLLCDGLLVTVAVIVIELLVGTTDGAV
jgi:hypothetical protein